MTDQKRNIVYLMATVLVVALGVAMMAIMVAFHIDKAHLHDETKRLQDEAQHIQNVLAQAMSRIEMLEKTLQETQQGTEQVQEERHAHWVPQDIEYTILIDVLVIDCFHEQVTSLGTRDIDCAHHTLWQRYGLQRGQCIHCQWTGLDCKYQRSG